MSHQIRRFKAVAGLNWLLAAWHLFKQNPGVFILMYLFIMVVSVIAGVVPMLAIPITLLVSFFTAGYYNAMLKAQQGQKIDIDELFKPLMEKGNRLALFRLGIYQILGATLLMFLSSFLFEGMQEPFENMMKAIEVQNIDLQAKYQAELVAAFRFSDLVVYLFSFAIYSMLFAYTIPLVFFKQSNGILDALQLSFRAFGVNAMPLTVFGIVAAVLMVISAFLFLLPLVVLLPILYIGFFISFQDMFQTNLMQPVDTEATQQDATNTFDA